MTAEVSAVFFCDWLQWYVDRPSNSQYKKYVTMIAEFHNFPSNSNLQIACDIKPEIWRTGDLPFELLAGSRESGGGNACFFELAKEGIAMLNSFFSDFIRQ